MKKFFGAFVRLVTIMSKSYTKLPDYILYMFGRTQGIFVLWPSRFCVSSVVDPVPNFTKWNPLVYRSVPVLIVYLFYFFCGCSLTGLPFLFELVTVVSQCALCHGYKPYATVFTWKCIVHYTNREGKSGVYRCVSSCVKALCFTATT